jgi:hypothetical protein
LIAQWRPGRPFRNPSFFSIFSTKLRRKCALSKIVGFGEP